MVGAAGQKAIAPHFQPTRSGGEVAAFSICVVELALSVTCLVQAHVHQVNGATTGFRLVTRQAGVVAFHHLRDTGVVARRPPRALIQFAPRVAHSQVGTCQPGAVKTVQGRGIGHLRIARGEQYPQSPDTQQQRCTHPCRHTHEHVERRWRKNKPLQDHQPSQHQGQEAEEARQVEQPRLPVAGAVARFGSKLLQGLHQGAQHHHHHTAQTGAAPKPAIAVLQFFHQPPTHAVQHPEASKDQSHQGDDTQCAGQAVAQQRHFQAPGLNTCGQPEVGRHLAHQHGQQGQDGGGRPSQGMRHPVEGALLVKPPQHHEGHGRQNHQQ